MTDIRKDFEEWFFPSAASADVNRDENGNYTWTKASYAWEGWQAGRTHGVDELIAEIERVKINTYTEVDAWHNGAVYQCIEIIRKHFGKE